MENNGNEQFVQQGENWNLDKVLSSSNREYIPYIVSSQRANPFFVVTVASTKYEKNYRYVKSWWNSPDEMKIPTFYQTVPQPYGEIDSESDIPSTATTLGDTKNKRYLYQYTLKSDSIDPALGHKPYYYFYYDFTNNNEGRLVLGYECKITFNFLSKDTAEWTGQNYLYQITLVSGEMMEDTLTSIYRDKGAPSDWPETKEAQYNYVKIQWPDELQPDIDIDSPLGRIDIPEPILPPTTLYVQNNLRNLI